MEAWLLGGVQRELQNALARGDLACALNLSLHRDAVVCEPIGVGVSLVLPPSWCHPE